MSGPAPLPVAARAASLGVGHLALLLSLVLHGALVGWLLLGPAPARPVGADGASARVELGFPDERAEPWEPAAAQSEDPGWVEPPASPPSGVVPPIPEADAPESAGEFEVLAAPVEPTPPPPLLSVLELPVRIKRPAPRDAPPAAAPATAPEPSPPRPVAAAPPARVGGGATAPAAGPPRLRVLRAPRLSDFYPAESRRRGEEGSVLVEFRVAADGTVGAARLAEASGVPRLDQAALALVRAFRFEPPGREVWARRRVEFRTGA